MKVSATARGKVTGTRLEVIRMRSKNHALMGLVFLFAGMAAGCADDPTASDEYAALE